MFSHNEILAVSPLPLVGQETLVRLGDKKVRSALVISTFLDPSVARTLSQDKCGWVKTKSYLLIDDKGTLHAAIHGDSATRAAHAARNKYADPDDLVYALDSKDNETALSAFINPSTPVDARKTRLTRTRAEELTNVGEPLSQAIVRTHELVYNNPWLIDDPKGWNAALRRAMVAMPFATLETVKAAKDAGWSRWPWLKFHPALMEGDPLVNWELKDLVNLWNPASDLYVVEHPNASVTEVQRMLGRSYHTEPHVFARALARFGPAVLERVTRETYIAGTRAKGAAWVHPLASIIDSWTIQHTAAFLGLQEAVSLLNPSVEAWENFTVLGRDWHGPFEDLAEAANRI